MKFPLLAAGLVVALCVSSAAGLGEIIYALNAGGESFTDSYGIRYRRDYLTVGTASDYGRMVDIKRVSPADKPLYETERYATETFGYTVPMPSGDGDYVLWLKFSEVWFNAPNLKVFDVSLNDVVVVKDLDIFDRVGRGVAHDEIVPFQVRQNKIVIAGKGFPFNNDIRVEFIKGYHDNPKINAMIVMKGSPDQVPQLPPHKKERTYEEFDEDEAEKIDRNGRDEEFDEVDAENDSEQEEIRKRRAAAQQNKDDDEEAERATRKKSSVPKIPLPPTVKVADPYEADETSYVIPILVAIGAFIPLLFCLCKL